MINLELYKIFVIVGNELNITKASEKLNISQPAITKHIKNLEKILGITLFKRNSRGLTFTEKGENLYNKLKEPINEILKVDNQLNQNEKITIGSHNHLLNVILGKSINQFYLQYPNVDVDLICLETKEMLEMLENKEIDIVFSKKVDNYKTKNIKYFHLGFLNDIFIANKNSCFVDKIFDQTCQQNATIYVPRKYAQTTNRLINGANNTKLDLKNSSYNTILEVVSKRKAVGFITKEYINNKDFEKYNLIELKNNLNIEPISFGVYYCIDKNNRVSNLIKIIKEQFSDK